MNSIFFACVLLLSYQTVAKNSDEYKAHSLGGKVAEEIGKNQSNTSCEDD